MIKLIFGLSDFLVIQLFFCYIGLTTEHNELPQGILKPIFVAKVIITKIRKSWSIIASFIIWSLVYKIHLWVC